jgi:hypothetical protein
MPFLHNLLVVAQDADPQTFPDSSAWVQTYGHYTNRVCSATAGSCSAVALTQSLSNAVQPAGALHGPHGQQQMTETAWSSWLHATCPGVQEPGCPYFVSLILYLNKEWHRDWGAETHVLDTSTGTGLIVEPKVCHTGLPLPLVTMPLLITCGRYTCNM